MTNSLAVLFRSWSRTWALLASSCSRSRKAAGSMPRKGGGVATMRGSEASKAAKERPSACASRTR
eukprot:scaffold9837_cov65-Phaeocystis_antarctica.AAC.2